MDLKSVMGMKQAWDTFRGNHPKFADFLAAVRNRGITEGTVLELSVKYPDGTAMRSNIRVKDSDMEMLQTMQTLIR